MTSDYLRRVEALELRITASNAVVAVEKFVSKEELEEVLTRMKGAHEKSASEQERRNKMPLAEQIALAEADHQRLAERKNAPPPNGSVAWRQLHDVLDAMHRYNIAALRAQLAADAS